MKLELLSEEEFSAFALKHHYDNYLQCVEFKHMKEAEGWKVYLFGGKEKEELKAAALICTIPEYKDYTLCSCPKGFLMDYHDEKAVCEFTKLVCAFLKKEKGMYLRVDPDLQYQEHDINGDIVEGGFNNQDCVDHLLRAGFKHEGFYKGIPANCHVRYTFVTSLKGEDENSLFKKMSKLTQRSIKNTEKFHVRVTRLKTKAELGKYMNIIKQTADRRHFEVYELSHYEKLLEFYGDKVWFLTADFHVKEYIDDISMQLEKEHKKLAAYGDELSEKQLKKKKLCEDAIQVLNKNLNDAQSIYEEKGEVVPLSAASFFIEQDQIIYFHGGSDNQYMKYCGQYAIQWHMIKEGLRRNHPEYNFNGLSGYFEKDAEDYGVYTFKKGFGGHIDEYVGYFNICINPIAQKMYGLSRRLKRK